MLKSNETIKAGHPKALSTVDPVSREEVNPNENPDSQLGPKLQNQGGIFFPASLSLKLEKSKQVWTSKCYMQYLLYIVYLYI